MVNSLAKVILWCGTALALQLSTGAVSGLDQGQGQGGRFASTILRRGPEYMPTPAWGPENNRYVTRPTEAPVSEGARYGEVPLYDKSYSSHAVVNNNPHWDQFNYHSQVDPKNQEYPGVKEGPYHAKPEQLGQVDMSDVRIDQPLPSSYPSSQGTGGKADGTDSSQVAKPTSYPTQNPQQPEVIRDGSQCYVATGDETSAEASPAAEEHTETMGYDTKPVSKEPEPVNPEHNYETKPVEYVNDPPQYKPETAVPEYKPKLEEEPKPEPPKVEESKPELPKVEEPKYVEYKPEPPKAKEPKYEESKPETLKVEEPKYEESKPEPPKAEEPKYEESKPEPPKVEDPKYEEYKPEPPKIEEPKYEESKPEPPKVEEPKYEEPKPEPPKVEEPKYEEYKPEPPKVEEPKYEEYKPEPPKIEEPKYEEPKPEPPKVEEPKYEEPTINPPVEEQPEEPYEPEFYWFDLY